MLPWNFTVSEKYQLSHQQDLGAHNRIHNLQDLRPDCPGCKFHLPAEEHFSVYQGSMTPFCTEGNWASEKLRGQVHIVPKWRTRIRIQPSWYLGQSSFYPTLLLLYSFVSLGPSIQNMSGKWQIFLEPNSPHRHTEPTSHVACGLRLEFKANGNRPHGGEEIPNLFGGQASCGRMQSRLFAHELTQKPRRYTEGGHQQSGQLLEIQFW